MPLESLVLSVSQYCDQSVRIEVENRSQKTYELEKYVNVTLTS